MLEDIYNVIKVIDQWQVNLSVDKSSLLKIQILENVSS